MAVLYLHDCGKDHDRKKNFQIIFHKKIEVTKPGAWSPYLTFRSNGQTTRIKPVGIINPLNEYIFLCFLTVLEPKGEGVPVGAPPIF